MQKIAFLDRDGTLNVDHGYVSKWSEFTWIEGTKDQLKRLKTMGYYLVVVTNQSGIARSMYTIEDVNLLHYEMNIDLKKTHNIMIDEFKICPHHPDFSGECDCRKPKTKLLKEVTNRVQNVDFNHSLMIGDKDSDYICGLDFGIKSFLLHSERYSTNLNTKLYRNLKEIVNSL